MRIVLFCENKYAIDILYPIQTEAEREGDNSVLWYVHKKKIPEFPLSSGVKWTNSMQEIYDFQPEAIFVPGNIVPYYLPGVKIQIFHGYAAEKKDHWIIRHYFDTYFTQGPYFTQKFTQLSKKYKDFEVLETGWTRQDWIKTHYHDYDEEKRSLLLKYGKKKIVLYAPTFSPSLTSLPHIKKALIDLACQKDILLLMKFHPLTRQKWVDEYQQMSDCYDNIILVNDFGITKYMLMADVMISDTSSTVYEFLLLDKPVITLRTIAKKIYWKNIISPDELCCAFDEVLHEPQIEALRQWIVANYDPYLDGQVARRMLDGARDYIKRYGVPISRSLNIWRKYTSVKAFGRIERK